MMAFPLDFYTAAMAALLIVNGHKMAGHRRSMSAQKMRRDVITSDGWDWCRGRSFHFGPKASVSASLPVRSILPAPAIRSVPGFDSGLLLGTFDLLFYEVYFLILMN